MSSPDWGLSGKKRQRFTGDEDDYRYMREPEDEANRQSPDSFSHMLPKEECFKYRKTRQDSRHRYQHEEVMYRQHDDCRQSSGYCTNRDDREWSRDSSQERTQSQEHSTKIYAKPRERNESPSTHHDDYRQNRSTFPLNGSNGQSFESDVTNQSAAVPEERNSTRGFQRFLDVLNKGVNVATLTKIVSQTSTAVGGRPFSSNSVMDTDRSWRPSYAERQQGNHQNTSQWPESNGSQRLAPSAVEKTTLTPEDEHKHRQMLDVLQAIGVNLGSEELGQMSHRIQERLYGKKDDARHRKGSRNMDTS